MIYKYFEANKIDFAKNKFVLFYGKNDGLKNQTINNLVKNKFKKTSYDEKEILENTNQFLDKILNRSLFDSDEIIIIKRVTDKILKVIEDISFVIKKLQSILLTLKSLLILTLFWNFK